MQHDAQRVGGNREALARRLGRPAGVVLQDARRFGDVPLCLCDRLADVERLEPRKLVRLGADQLRRPGQHPAALVIGCARPPAAAVERGTGPADCGVDGRLIHVRDRCDPPRGRRINDLYFGHPRTNASRAAARPVRTAPSM
jgi:hypothetical protein